MIKRNKRAVSLMLSYVLLVVIAISLSVGVYVWLKKYASVGETPKCPEDVSLILQDYFCNSTEKTISVNVKNKGLFNIDGYDISGANDTKKEPIFPLEDKEKEFDVEVGRYFFGLLGKTSLKPSKNDTHVFSYEVYLWEDLKKIGIEPFRIQNDYVILCENAKIIQEVNCQS